MGNNLEKCGTSEHNTSDNYKKEITDIVNNLEDEVFLRRIYIVLRKHIEKRGN